MNTLVTESNETTLTIFKLLREINKWYGPITTQHGELKAQSIHGLIPVWRPTEDGMLIMLDTDHATYATVEWKHKSTELFVQDMVIKISDRVAVPTEVLEHLLIGVVRLYGKFKELV